MARLLVTSICAGERAVICSSMNTAVKNITYQTQEIADEAGVDPLLVVLGTTHIETMAIVRCDRENVKEVMTTIRKPRLEDALKGGVGKHWQWRLSVAEWTLKLAGLLETSNPAIIALRKDHFYFIQIMQTPWAERDEEMRGNLLKERRWACKAIIAATEGLFCTITRANSKGWGHIYLRKSTVTAIDEGGALTDAELLIPRRAGSPLIICGDSKQLPPKVFSQDKMVRQEAGSIPWQIV
jgi:hypothetical protein